METICINCPVGCRLTIKEVDGEIVVTGNNCPRGLSYGRSEYVCPKRVVTSLVKIGNQLYSVKTSQPIEKTKMFDIINFISGLKLDGNYEIGDCLVENILDTGANLLVTGKNAVEC